MNIIKGDVSWGFQAVQSTFCVQGDCVTVAPGPGRRCVMVWNSTNALVVQVWDLDDWDDLLQAIKERRLDTYAQVVTSASLLFLLPIGPDEPVVEFTNTEWEAFCEGVDAGEFEFDKLSSPAPGGPVAGRTAATGAVEPGVVPAPVVAGMNAAGYAAMNVPAGRDLRDESTPVGSLDAVATTGQPGLEISDEAVEAAAIRLKVNAECHGAFTTLHTMRQWARAALTAALPLLGPPAPAWGSGPLVKFDLPDTSHAAVDMGWASPDGLVNEAGEVGPGTEHPSSGPTEPADDCGNTCFVHKGLAEQAERERARA